MLSTFIQRARRRLLRRISAFYAQRYLPETVIVPSGRFGVYSVASELLSRGDRVLISPLTCHTVIQSLVRAGAVPTFVDVELETGNIDPAKLSDRMLRDAKAIVSTNLYGNPDDVEELHAIARRHGLYLIEDCAHVLHTVVRGRPIGSFGDASIFSFKKYFGETGGVVTLRDRSLRERVAARTARETTLPAPVEEALRFGQYLVERSAGLALARNLSALARRLSGSGAPSAKPRSDDGAAGMGREYPTTAALARVAACLNRHDELVRARVRQSEELIRESGLFPRRSSRAEELCYMVVPFWSARRDQMISGMKDRGVPTYYTYCPPMDEVFRAGVRSEQAARERVASWCEHVLPVDVKNGRVFLEEVRRQCK